MGEEQRDHLLLSGLHASVAGKSDLGILTSVRTINGHTWNPVDWLPIPWRW